MTSNNEWVPLTTAATQSGRALDYIHGLVNAGIIPVTEKPLTSDEAITLVRVSDVRAVSAHLARSTIHDSGGKLPASLSPVHLQNHNCPSHESKITRLEDELHRVAEHSLSQGKRLRAKTIELDRVRTELEALRDYYVTRESRSRERMRGEAATPARAHLANMAHGHKRTHEAITRILEGSADE